MDKAYSHIKVRSFVLVSMVLLGIIVEAVIYFFFPANHTGYTLFIPIYFLLLALSMLFAVSRINSKQLHIGRAWARVLLLNMFQLVLSVFILYYYIRYIDEQRPTFLLVFGIFYLWFLGLKTFVLYNIDNHHKKNKKLEKLKKNNEKQ